MAHRKGADSVQAEFPFAINSLVIKSFTLSFRNCKEGWFEFKVVVTEIGVAVAGQSDSESTHKPFWHR